MTRSHFGSIQRISTNRYRVWWTEGGRRRSRYISGTRDDAERELASIRLSCSPETITWAQFYIRHVEPTYQGLAETTVAGYRRLWSVELEPRIGGEQVSLMGWSRANDVLTSISSPTVQRSAGRLLKKMCNIAVRMGMLSADPVRAIQYAPHRPMIKRLVDVADVSAFMVDIEGIKYEAPVLLMLGAGLRPEEALALTWEDVSPYEMNGRTYARVAVSKALTVANGRKVLKDTKNTASERDAICGEPFASRVLALADGETGPLVASGSPWMASEPATQYSSPVTVSHNWRQWCSRNGVKYVPLKNMRSSYATMMGEAMAPDSVVAGNMGHSASSVKSRHYQRVTMRAKCMAADLLADLIESLG